MADIWLQVIHSYKICSVVQHSRVLLGWLKCKVNEFQFPFELITVRSGKVIFSQACVKNSVHRGVRGRRDGHYRGRYASYWNAFLFLIILSVPVGCRHWWEDYLQLISDLEAVLQTGLFFRTSQRKYLKSLLVWQRCYTRTIVSLFINGDTF